jgi:hypothetical protein
MNSCDSSLKIQRLPCGLHEPGCYTFWLFA